MSKRKQTNRRAAQPAATLPHPSTAAASESRFPVWWMTGLLVFTAVVFAPMLQNTFTNWDDEAYVVNNLLLRGPDWRGIFTQPVVSNYHPLTVLSLALNYQISQLSPFSYYLLNGMLHLANTGLVFYFIWLISGRLMWVALFTALVFGVHPMHVESVAWISERKDVLYTLFFLLALVHYWRFVVGGRRWGYWLCFGFFLLAVLSKPAAVVLPLVLLLLDYWQKRSFTRSVLLEKIPFLAVSLFTGWLTVVIQSEKALVSLSKYSLVDRAFFGCYGLVTYLWRFVAPTPLSAFHPYPEPGAIGWVIRISPLILVALVGLVWYFRKNRPLVFGALFYLVNILLVVQFIAVGNTLLSERYTYVPYIGVAFGLAMMLMQTNRSSGVRPWQWGLLVLAGITFGAVSRQRTKVWRNTETLWSDVVRTYPGTPIPHANRANFYYQEALKPENRQKFDLMLDRALADCNAALKTNPNHFASLDVRSLIYIRRGRFQEAFADADRMVQSEPANKKGYLNRGSAGERLKQYDAALADYSKCLALDPDNADARNGRGTVLFNANRQYSEALAEFEKAISIKPEGSYFLNCARCYYMLGNRPKALECAETAQKMGVVADKAFMDLLRK